jgi:hypothetical protein
MAIGIGQAAVIAAPVDDSATAAVSAVVATETPGAITGGVVTVDLT